MILISLSLTSYGFNSYVYADDIVLFVYDKNLELAISTLNEALFILTDVLLHSHFLIALDKS